MIELHHPNSDTTVAVEMTTDGLTVEVFGDDGTYTVRRDDHDVLEALCELLPLAGWEVVV